MNFIPPRYAILFLNSKIYIVYVINLEWNRSIFCWICCVFCMRYKTKFTNKLTKAYSKIKFHEFEVVQANAKVEWVSSKKLDEVLSHQKPFSDKNGLGYTRESISVVNISKEVKFVKAKEPVVISPIVEKEKVEKKKNVANQWVLNKPHNLSMVRSEARGKSLPRPQRGPRTNHFCHHCGLQGHTRPNCHKFKAFKNASA